MPKIKLQPGDVNFNDPQSLIDFAAQVQETFGGRGLPGVNDLDRLSRGARGRINSGSRSPSGAGMRGSAYEGLEGQLYFYTLTATAAGDVSFASSQTLPVDCTYLTGIIIENNTNGTHLKKVTLGNSSTDFGSAGIPVDLLVASTAERMIKLASKTQFRDVNVTVAFTAAGSCDVGFVVIPQGDGEQSSANVRIGLIK